MEVVQISHKKSNDDLVFYPKHKKAEKLTGIEPDVSSKSNLLQISQKSNSEFSLHLKHAAFDTFLASSKPAHKQSKKAICTVTQRDFDL